MSKKLIAPSGRQIYVPKGYQDEITDFQLSVPRCHIWAGMGMGKQQPVSEPVLTPEGWRPIGSITQGDRVMSVHGTPTEVTGVYPQGIHDVYEVRFNDGSYTRAGLEHLWAVATPRDRGDYKIKTTDDLINEGLTDGAGNRKWSIPLTAPVQHSTKELTVDPYLLGVILGDGYVPENGSVAITSDTEILDQWEGYVGEHPSEGIATRHLRGLRGAMRDMGLNGKRSWEKHVPGDYMVGDVHQRLGLLQGLLDTDGYPIPTGGVEFSSTSEKLADAVRELAESLGGVARKSAGRFTRYQNGTGRESWRVNVKLPAEFIPFRLSRKACGWVPPTKYPPMRAISSVSLAGREESVCISVACPSKLYLTRGHIVTHNTVSSLTYVDRLIMQGMSNPTLVLAPLLVAKTSWPDECEKWEHLRHMSVTPVVGNEADRMRALRSNAEVFSINYDNLEWLVNYFGDRWPFELVIADEVTRLKGFRTRQGTRRAKALAQVAHTKVKRFCGLTGTPVPNGVKDLWATVWFIDAGKRLGRSYSAFTKRWFAKGYDGFSITPHEHSQEEIQGRLKGVCLTVDSKDWFDLKEPIVTDRMVDLPPKARKLYDEMEKLFFFEIEKHQVEAFHAATRSQKLLQLSNGAVYVDPLVESDDDPRARMFKEVHRVKIEALDSICTEANGMPVLVAYNFKSDLARLQKAFPKAEVLTSKNGVETMKRWNEGKIPMLLVHPKSAAHGLNLQYGGNIMVYYSIDWNLEERLQVLERIGPVRQAQAGLNRPVFVYNIVARDTIDELVLARVSSKAEVQDLLLAAMKNRKKNKPLSDALLATI